MNEQQQFTLQIARRKEGAKLFGLPLSTFYDRVNNGLLPPAISLGGGVPKGSWFLKLMLF